MIDSDPDIVALEQKIQDSFAMNRLDSALAPCLAAVDLATKRYGRRDVRNALALQMLSIVHRALGAWPEAEATLKEALEIRREVLGSDHPAVGSTLHLLAQLYADQGDVGAALKCCTLSFSIRGAALGPMAPLTLRTGRDLAVLQRRRLAADPSAQAPRLYQHGCAAYEAGRYDEAETALAGATTINRETLGDDHPHVASCLNRLGEVYKERAKALQAYAAQREALYIRRLHPEGDPMDLALALSRFASVELSMGQTTEALRHAEEAAASVIDTAPSAISARRAYVQVLHVLGYVQRAASRLAEAEATFQTAIDVLGEPDAEDSEACLAMATLLANLAVLKADAGKYAAAKADYRHALALKMRVVGQDHPSYARTAVNFAALLATLWEMEAAWHLLRPAAKTLDRVFGETHPDTLHARLIAAEIGIMRRSSDHATEAESEELEKLLTAYERNQTLDARGLREVRLKVSRQRMDSGDLAGAERLLLACLDDIANASSEDHREDTYARYELARLRLLQGDSATAQELLDIVCSRLHGDDVGDFGVFHNSLIYLAAIAIEQDPQRARRYLDEATQAENNNLKAIFAAVGEDGRMEHIREMELALGIYLMLVRRRLPDSEVARWAVADLVLRRKGVVRDVLLRERAALRGGDDPQARQQFSELAQVRAAIARAALDGPSMSGLTHSEQALRALRRRRNELEESLLPHLTTASAISAIIAADARRIAAALPGGSILLEYVRTPVLVLPGLDEVPASYYAVVLQRDHVPDVIMIGTADQVDEMSDRYLKLVGAEPETRNNPDALRLLGTELRELVLDRALDGAALPRELLVCPAGQLWRVPFDALPLDRTGWVIDECKVRYLASGRWLNASSQERSAEVGPPAIVGDPDFDAADPTGWEERYQREMSREVERAQCGEAMYPFFVTRTGQDNDAFRFEPLPDSKREVIRVGRLLGVEPVLGGGATKAHLKGLRSPRVLHVATHGLFISDPAELQNLDSLRLLHGDSWSSWESDAVIKHSLKQLVRLARELESVAGDGKSQAAGPGQTTDGDASPDEIPDAAAVEDIDPAVDSDGDPFRDELASPFLRSGLVLAGFNTWLLRGAVSEACGNGLLSTAEVAEMDLDGTELVVLSACDTGVGMLEHPDGVLGLRRAFAVAGARSLVLTLWSLPDKEGIEMMEHFYQRLLDGVARGDALHAARLLLRQRGIDPFFWGSLVLEGDDAPIRL